MERGAWLVLVLLMVLGSGCGDDAEPEVQAGSVIPGVTSDGLNCMDRVSIHGDPAPDFVGESTVERAVTASRAGSVGVSQEREDGRWLVRYQGDGVALLEVSEAPGGGFWVFGAEMCPKFADLLDSGALNTSEGGGYEVQGLGEDDRSVVLRCSEPQWVDFTPAPEQTGVVDPFAAVVSTLKGSPPGWGAEYVDALVVETVESEDPVYVVLRDPQNGSVVALAEVLELSRDSWAVHLLTYCDP